MRLTPRPRCFVLLLSVFLLAGTSFGIVPKKKAKRNSKPIVAKPLTRPPNAARELRKHRARPKHANSFLPTGGRVGSGPWKEPTFADSTVGDQIDGEDLVVRRAAVEAL